MKKSISFHLLILNLPWSSMPNLICCLHLEICFCTDMPCTCVPARKFSILCNLGTTVPWNNTHSFPFLNVKSSEFIFFFLVAHFTSSRYLMIFLPLFLVGWNQMCFREALIGFEVKLEFIVLSTESSRGFFHLLIGRKQAARTWETGYRMSKFLFLKIGQKK